MSIIIRKMCPREGKSPRRWDPGRRRRRQEGSVPARRLSASQFLLCWIKAVSESQALVHPSGFRSPLHGSPSPHTACVCSVVHFLEFAVLPLLLTPGWLLNRAFPGVSSPHGWLGNVARVTAAIYKATCELNERFQILVLIFVLKRATGRMQYLI